MRTVLDVLRPEPRGHASEAHHHQYGRPWCIGRDQLDYLVGRGLLPEHRVLDLGCGAGRAAIWLARYLEPERYFGIDAHLASLEAAAHYEIPLHGLEDRGPRFLHSSEFETQHWGVSFDWVLAFSVLNHVEREHIGRALRNSRDALSPSGRIVLSHHLPPERDIEASGLRVSHRETTPCALIDDRINWFELSPVGSSAEPG